MWIYCDMCHNIIDSRECSDCSVRYLAQTLIALKFCPFFHSEIY